MFKVRFVDGHSRPQLAVWIAMHQDYAEDFVGDHLDEYFEMDEKTAGERVIKHLFKSKHRPHLGPFEHPHLTLAVGFFPHDTVMQMRTHRIATFDVQSMRYTGDRIVKFTKGELDFDDVFYLPTPGTMFTDRQGNKTIFDDDKYEFAKQGMIDSAHVYAACVEMGITPEVSRRVLAAGYRQHFVMTINARVMMHLLDMRGAADVQDECRNLAVMMLEEFEKWMPEVAAHYRATRWTKSTLAP